MLLEMLSLMFSQMCRYAVVEGDLQDVVCLFVHLDVDIVDVDGADVLLELLDVDELVGILDVVVVSCCTC